MWLVELQHDVRSIHQVARGSDDDKVLQMAIDENRILITCDKDFGEMVFQERKTQNGVVLLRLVDERADNKIAVLSRLLEQYPDRLANNFVVATEAGVRIAGLGGR